MWFRMNFTNVVFSSKARVYVIKVLFKRPIELMFRNKQREREFGDQAIKADASCGC